MSEINGGATLRKERPSPPRGNSTASEPSTKTAGQIEDEKGALRALNQIRAEGAAGDLASSNVGANPSTHWFRNSDA
jgi:hypothetical protein